MFKRKIGIIYLLLMITILISGTTVVKAYTNFEKVVVTKATDWESGKRTKLSDKYHASLQITYLENAGKSYSAWVEKYSSGLNISEIESFSTTGVVDKMTYKTGYLKLQDSVKLNISTSITTLQSTQVSGKWTPNY